MSEIISTIHERADDRRTRDFFAQYGHVAIADAYDSMLGDLATLAADRSARLHTNKRLGGQVGDINYGHLRADNPIRRVIVSIIQNLELIGEPFEAITNEELRVQVIDHRPRAEGVWHQDKGVAVATLNGSSWLEIKGSGDAPDAAYELIPGRIVIMNPTLLPVHRGVAGGVSRTGLAIERVS